MKSKLVVLFSTIIFCSTIASAQVEISLKDSILSILSIAQIVNSTAQFHPLSETKIAKNHRNVRRYVARVGSFMWDSLAIDHNKYDSLFLYTFSDLESENRKLSIIKEDGTSNLIYDQGEFIDLTFYSATDAISIPLTLKNLNDKNLVFSLGTFHVGYVPELEKNIIIWPFEMGVSIVISDSIPESIGNFVDHYRLNEEFNFNDSSSIYFSNYDYKEKKISYHVGKKKDKLFGYKVNQYISPSLIKDDKLNVLYFGGHWNRGSSSENPKLKKISELSEKHNIDLKVHLIYTEGTKEKAASYHASNLSSIRHELVLSGSNHKVVGGLRICSFPTYVFIDPEGKILYRSDGDDEDPHSYLWKLLKG